MKEVEVASKEARVAPAPGVAHLKRWAKRMKRVLPFAVGLIFSGCATSSSRLTHVSAEYVRDWTATVSARYDLVALTAFLIETALQQQSAETGSLAIIKEDAKWFFRPDTPMLTTPGWTFATRDAAKDEFVLFTGVHRGSTPYTVLFDCERTSAKVFRLVRTRVVETDDYIPGRGLHVFPSDNRIQTSK